MKTYNYNDADHPYHSLVTKLDKVKDPWENGISCGACLRWFAEIGGLDHVLIKLQAFEYCPHCQGHGIMPIPWSELK